MSLKEFLIEEREEKKKRKLEQKEIKKSSKTKEQRYYKVAGIICGILVTFGALFNACSGLAGSDFDFGSIIGITDEMIDAINEPVDENLLFIDGRIGNDDLTACKDILNGAGANVLDYDEELVAESTFVLNSKQLGAMANEILLSEDMQIKMSLLDLDIYAENDVFYEKTITQVDLNNIIEGKSLPKVYLTSVSKIAILGDELKILNTDLRINMLEDEINDKIIKILKSYNDFSLVDASNDMVNTVINLFSSSVKTKIYLQNDGIEFRV